VKNKTREHEAHLLGSLKNINRLFTTGGQTSGLVGELKDRLDHFADQTSFGGNSQTDSACAFLFASICQGEFIPVSRDADSLRREFVAHVKSNQFESILDSSLDELDRIQTFHTLRHWLNAFVVETQRPIHPGVIGEAAVLMIDRDADQRPVLEGSTRISIESMVGSHSVIRDSIYRTDYDSFLQRLREHESLFVPTYKRYSELKHQLIEEKRFQLRLEEFKPHVLTSFVRNRLIGEVYLPMIGDNLAKQIGVAGEQKRTDLMGLLLLVSPPGYGKTTLMEYVANRLGLTFVKINGPAIGHGVTSLDPAEAPNAGARQEIHRLNLALEMGDNVMIYMDDIQHCHPEFLQKFISLCDGQRRIEGVYNDRSRTYDLRGRKVCVVMAGNPYTESGDKFQIPDMLANRADTYNLGDVIGDQQLAFELSYLENALTSNPILNQLAMRSQQDVYQIIKMAECDDPDGIDLEGSYTAEELNDFVSVMKRLIRIRDVVLKVNSQYIESAAQANEYRTEPPFRLQGSYRDMNKMAERIVPIMNDEELDVAIKSHYENQAQTLTGDAEANLLKLQELLDRLSDDESKRWEEIKRTFNRNQLMAGADPDDPLGQLVAQITTVSDGLNAIRQSVHESAQLMIARNQSREDETAVNEPLTGILEQLDRFNESFADMNQRMAAGDSGLSHASSEQVKLAAIDAASSVKVVHRVPRVFLDLVKMQFGIIESWIKPFLELSQTSSVDVRELHERIDEAMKGYQETISRLEEASKTSAKDRLEAPS